MNKQYAGFPIVSLREFNLLMLIHHPNVIALKEVVIGNNLDKYVCVFCVWCDAVCVCVCLSVCMRVCMCVYVYIYVRVCVCAYMCVLRMCERDVWT